MFSDVYGSSSMLTDLRRMSAVSVSSEKSSTSSLSSTTSSAASFAAASRLEEAADEEDGGGGACVGSAAAAARQRRPRSLSSALGGLERRLSLYGPTPRLASSLPQDQEVQAVNPSTGLASAEPKLDPSTMSTAGALLAGPTMQFLLSGGNPASLIPASARRAFRFRRVNSRSRIASANYTPMSAGGPLSLTRLFAALVLLCTVGVLVAPIPASAIRPHTRSYTAHRPAGTHHHHHASTQDHQIIEAGHLIPLHYSAGMFNGRFGSSHAQYAAQRRSAVVASRQENHAAVLSKLEATKRGAEAVSFEYDPRTDHSTFEFAASAALAPASHEDATNEHRPRTGMDLLDISRGLEAIAAEADTESPVTSQHSKDLVSDSQRTLEKIRRLAAEGHNRHRYASAHSLNHHQQQQRQQQQQPVINSADLSPFARPPPSLAAADLFDPQSVFSQPAGSVAAAAAAAAAMLPPKGGVMMGGVDLIQLGLGNSEIAPFDTGFAGLRGQSFRSHLRSLA
ncbi:hypothetical protein OC834_001091 [Tilletia horrida]|uniref:Uncharacterized protein n=1 Tax=Tilletia horrida TaxID=155126 RepID=A0AAN6GIJ6_9BASI|nr:hypothetical protein OC834_001091 [Tilletia horrida]KAK0539668.1 hypothetical protein OC842_000859 [Tilletia horrida]KAK0564197.1 hypothetical protein OC844_001840 [Tilletia horrida]